MSNEHLPIDHPWAGEGWSRHIRARLDQRFDQIGHDPTTQAFVARLSAAMIYIAAAMFAFILAIDGYVLLRTM